MPDDFEELRKTLAHAQEIFERLSPGVTKSYVEPVFGEETPMDAIVHVFGVGTMKRVQVRDEIRRRLTLYGVINDEWFRNTYHSVFGSGVLKAMFETELRHQGLEL